MNQVNPEQLLYWKTTIEATQLQMMWGDVIVFDDHHLGRKTLVSVAAERTAGRSTDNNVLNGPNQWGDLWLKAHRCIIIDRHLQPQLVMNERMMMMTLGEISMCVYCSDKHL